MLCSLQLHIFCLAFFCLAFASVNDSSLCSFNSGRVIKRMQKLCRAGINQHGFIHAGKAVGLHTVWGNQTSRFCDFYLLPYFHFLLLYWVESSLMVVECSNLLFFISSSSISPGGNRKIKIMKEQPTVAKKPE